MVRYGYGYALEIDEVTTDIQRGYTNSAGRAFPRSLNRSLLNKAIVCPIFTHYVYLVLLSITHLLKKKRKKKKKERKKERKTAANYYSNATRYPKSISIIS